MRSSLVTIGEAMLRLSPSDGQPLSNSGQLSVSVGGAELNVAIAAHRMGLPSAWVTQLPDGVLSDKVVMHAREHGVEPLVVRGEGRVGLYFVEIAEDPRGVTVTYDRDWSSARTLSLGDVQSLVVDRDFSALFSSGITLALGPGPREAVGSVFEAHRSRRRFFEVNYRSKLTSVPEMRSWVNDLLPHIDVLFASSHDLINLLAFGDDLRTAVDKALSNHELEFVVVSDRQGRVGGMGRNSIRVFGHGVDAEHHSDGRIVDPIGAGDAGAGVFIADIEQGVGVDDAARHAVLASAWVQTYPGDAALFRREDLIEVDDRRIRR